MTEPPWATVEAPQSIIAPSAALWVKVADYIHGPRKLKIVATGTWNFDLGRPCGPDGEPSEGFADSNAHHGALKGCLIAKIGGSAGDNPASDKLFAIGSFAIINIGDAAGTLFVGMNDAPVNCRNHSGGLTIAIWDAP
jgi:hypothetical protein